MMPENSQLPPTVADPRGLRERAGDCAILIVTAGFERRARRTVEMLQEFPPRVALIRYPPGIPENDATVAEMTDILKRARTIANPLTIDPRRPDELNADLKRLLVMWRPDATGEVWVDISALPMQGICSVLAAVRETLPSLVVRVLYTEAMEYFPRKRDVNIAESQPEARGPAALSHEMSGNLIPKHFSGSSSEVSTCLLVFAGYEKHRSIGVVDELNPSKLVLLFGKPEREELLWRLKWSQRLHEPLFDMRPTASEIVSTLNPWDSLRTLAKYYGFLFFDHNIALSPICSKMQCVASYLFWEHYRDVQLVFPLPVTYLTAQFSERYRNTYEFVLPSTSQIADVLASPL